MAAVDSIPLEWEGRMIGTAKVVMKQEEPPIHPGMQQDIKEVRYTMELTDVEPIWLRTALMDSIIKQNAYAMRKHR